MNKYGSGKYGKPTAIVCPKQGGSTFGLHVHADTLTELHSGPNQRWVKAELSIRELADLAIQINHALAFVLQRETENG